MDQTDENETVTTEKIVREAVGKLSDEDLWSLEQVKQLYALAKDEDWVVNGELRKRREIVKYKEALPIVNKEQALQGVFQREEYDDFSAYLAGLSKLLDEYDHLETSPESNLRYFDYRFKEPTAEQSVSFERRAKLRELLQAKGIDVIRRDGLIRLLTDFKMALADVDMNKQSVNSPDCELIEPTVSYLSNPDIQNGFLTRFFALCFLTRLRKELAPYVKVGDIVRGVGILGVVGFIVLFLQFGYPVTRQIVSGNWPFVAGLLVLFGVWLGKRVAISKANSILKLVIDKFSRLNGPVTFDGPELVEDLRRMKKLGVGVPSLLFSLFRITVPGR